MADYVVPDNLATPADLAAWTGTAVPSNAVPLMRSCSAMVLAATKLAIYATDTSTGLPSDLTILKCMNDATCIQAAAWIALGIDPLAGGVDLGGVKKSKKIGSASFEIAGAEQTAAARANAVKELVPDAIKKLRQQNLISYWPSREYGYGYQYGYGFGAGV